MYGYLPYQPNLTKEFKKTEKNWKKYLVYGQNKVCQMVPTDQGRKWRRKSRFSSRVVKGTVARHFRAPFLSFFHRLLRLLMGTYAFQGFSEIFSDTINHLGETLVKVKLLSEKRYEVCRAGHSLFISRFALRSPLFSFPWIAIALALI